MLESARSSARSYSQLIAALGLNLGSAAIGGIGSPSGRPDRGDRLSPEDFVRPCNDGKRTQQLLRLAGGLLGDGCGVRVATDVCLAWNTVNTPPLDEEKIRTTVASIARTHARNHPTNTDLDRPLFDLSTASVGRFFGKEVPPRDWVLEDCLPRGKVGLIVAPGGTGKSQLVLQIGYAIATGFDKYSPWKPGRAGQVVIIGAEDEEDEVHRRFERLVRADMTSGDAEQTLQRLRDNLFIAPRVGEDNLFTRDDGTEVRRTGLVERIAKTVAPLTDLRAIIADPAARFRGGEENAAEDTTRFVEALEALAKLTGAAVLVVHHVNKASMQGGDANQSASRGSSALSDGVRLQINLGYPNQDEQARLGRLGPGKFLVVKITKTNCTVVGEPIYLRRDDEGRLFRVDIEEQKLSLDEEQIALIVTTVREQGVQNRHYSKSGFASTYGGRDNIFRLGQSALKRLIDRAIRDRRLGLVPGKQKQLRPVEPIPKAKIAPAPTIVDDGSK